MRSDGRVYYFTLTPLMQKVVLSLVLFFLGWLLVANGTAFQQRSELKAREVDFREALISYNHLRQNMVTYQDSVEEITNRIVSYRKNSHSEKYDSLLEKSLKELATIRTKITSAFTHLNRDFTVDVENQQTLVLSRTVLHSKIDTLKNDLAGNREKTRDIHAKIALLNQKLTPPDDNGEKAESGERPVVDSLDSLDEGIDVLLVDRDVTKQQKQKLNHALSTVIDALSTLSGTSDSLFQAATADEEALFLIEKVQNLQKSQQQIVDGLIARTEENMNDFKNIMAIAGLNPEVFFGKAVLLTGQGGPLEELNSANKAGNFSNNPSPSHLSQSVSVLEERLDSWNKMKKFLTRMPLIPPLDNYQLTSPFGKRRDPITKKWALHKGIDLGGWPGLKVRVSAPGTVIFAGKKPAYGYVVEVDHGYGLTTLYAHMRSLAVKKGDIIKHRSVVGEVGSTGRSTGPHVHFEIKLNQVPMDPERFIRAGKYVFKT